MAKKTTSKEWILKTLEKWRLKLGLSLWTVSVDFVSQKDVDQSSEGRFQTLCTVSVEQSYQRAVVNIFPAFHNRDRDSQEKALVHELCHCITEDASSTMYRLKNHWNYSDEQIENTVEKLTEKIASLVFQTENRVKEIK